MSSPLALAGVTYVLRDLLNDGLVNHDLAANVKVTARPPLREPTPASGAQSQLNLFLYQVTPNTGWRNAALPARDSDGARVAHPPLALDLHYLLTAYDERDYHAEILLGCAMQLLHENPGLSRQQIRASLQEDLTAGAAAGLPDELKKLKSTGLADQIESLKITPHYLGTDEMSKLWTGFQAPYRPSMAYQVSVVLIETTKPARTALPVLTRGAGGSGFPAQASLLAPLPTRLAALPPDRQPAVESDGTFKLFGHHLRGADLTVTLRHARLDLELKVAGTTGAHPPLVVRAPEPDGADAGEQKQIPPEADTCIVVDLNQASGTAAAGWHSVELSVRLEGETQDRVSNVLALALAPRFATSGASKPVVTSLGGSRYRVKLKCVPTVQPGQPVALLLGQNELLPPEPLTAPAASVSFEGALPGAGDYLARLRVDGVDSLFILRPEGGPPGFDPAQSIQVP